MKILLLMFLVSVNCYAEIVDGNTNAIASPRDLSLNTIEAGGSVDPTQTTSIKNYVLTNLSGQDRLWTFTSPSLLVLENTTLDLDGTYTFTHGSIRIVGNCAINGSSDFNKFRFESHLIHITEGAELRIGPGVNFEYAPTGSTATGIRFGSSSSKLTLEDATLTISNRHGLNLIKGTLRIEGNSTIDNYFTEDTVAYLDTKVSFTEAALVLGNGPADSNGDCKLKITSGAKLTVKNAGIIYRNNKVGAFDGADGNGSLVIDKRGSFLIDSTGDFNNGGVSFNFDNLNSKKRLGVLSSMTSIDTVAYNGTYIRASAWSPDGKYVVVGGNGSSEVELYSFDGSSITSIDSVTYNGSAVWTCAWSPDGKYVVVGGEGANEVEIYSFDGSSLTSIATVAYNGTYIRGCSWSPDGKYIVVGGDVDVEVYRFDGSSMTSIDTVAFNGTAIYVCAWSPDGKYIVVGGDVEVELYSFNGSSLTSIDSVAYNGTYVYGCAWSPNGKYVMVGGNGGSEVELYSVDGSSITSIDSVTYNGTYVWGCAWSPDGKYVVGGGDGDVEVYSFNGSSLTSIATVAYNGTYIRGCSWSPDVKYIVVGGNGSSEVEVYRFNYLVDDQNVSIFKDSTIKLEKDLILRDINLSMK